MGFRVGLCSCCNIVLGFGFTLGTSWVLIGCRTSRGGLVMISVAARFAGVLWFLIASELWVGAI